MTEDPTGKEVTERSLVESRWLQRLRRIFQLQCTWMVYPGAHHTRFLHSIGAMHLAGKFASNLWESYIRNVGEDIPSKNYVVQVMRLAGLLHDVGHGPMGHTLDEIYAIQGWDCTHEDIGRKIIVEELGDEIRSLRRSIDGPFQEEIDPDVVADFVKLPRGRSFDAPWKRHFSKILTGLYSADNLDYLVRDSYFCGTREYGLVDAERFIHSTFMTEEGVTLHLNSVPTLKAYLFSRAFMYENVYFHRTVRAYDFSFEDLLLRSFPHLGIKNPLEDLSSFFFFDDWKMYSLSSQWMEASDPERRELSGAWARLQAKELSWKLAYELKFYPGDRLAGLFDPQDVGEKIHKLVLAELGEEIPLKVDVPFLTLRPGSMEAAGKKDVVIWDPLAERADRLPLQEIFRQIPTTFLVPRVYCPREYLEKIREIAPQALGRAGFVQKTSY
jgi:HD superfamily phosphohydrolase